MSYADRLGELINDKMKFVRCFYGECPKCGKHIFSIDDQPVDDKIKAKFICDCGHKYTQTVYSAKMNKYRYPQALIETIHDRKYGEIRVLKLKGRYYFVHEGKVVSKRIKGGTK